MRTKQALLIGAGVLTIGAAGLGASASTYALNDSNSNGESSLVDKLVSTFKLNKTEVQALFDEQHMARETEMKTTRDTALSTALKNSKITQAQYDHITDVWTQADALRGSDKTEADRTKMRTLMDNLKTWMTEQKIDRTTLGMPEHGRGGPGGRHEQ